MERAKNIPWGKGGDKHRPWNVLDFSDHLLACYNFCHLLWLGTRRRGKGVCFCQLGVWRGGRGLGEIPQYQSRGTSNKFKWLIKTLLGPISVRIQTWLLQVNSYLLFSRSVRHSDWDRLVLWVGGDPFLLRRIDTDRQVRWRESETPHSSSQKDLVCSFLQWVYMGFGEIQFSIFICHIKMKSLLR